jgi:hypothetical protein
MTRKFKIILSSIALIFGCLIVFISLANVNPVSSEGVDRANNNKTFYFSKTILPDNLLYPAFRIIDRVKIITAEKNEKIFLRINYGLKRLETSQILLSQNKNKLALITLSKSHHYLIQATEQYLKQKPNQLILDHLETALFYQRTTFNDIKDQFDDADRAKLDKIIQENEVYLKRIKPNCQIEKNLIIDF